MQKRLEIMCNSSCLNKAGDDEPVFVLRAKDKAAPLAIRLWCHERVMLGLNKGDDEQIVEARECADQMDDYRKRVFGK